MKSISRITILFFTLLCLSFLSGCGGSVSDPSPSVSRTIFLETGESAHFSVKGDEPFSGPGDNALIYQWTIYKYGDTPSSLSSVGTDVLEIDYLAAEGDEQYGYIGVTLTVTRKVEKTPGLVSVTNSTFRWEVKVGTSSQIAPVWMGDFYYKNSNDVDSLTGFNVISGDLLIKQISPSTLPNLENIQQVGGDVSISYNDRLKSLAGLSLSSVQGALRIEGNYSLKTLKGLEHLQTIEGGLYVKGNVQLEDINGLNNIESIGETLTIESNSKLVDVEGLENIVLVQGDVEISTNHLLTSLQGLDRLETIGGSLQIHNHNALETLQGLESLTLIGGALTLRGNDVLTQLSGLQSLGFVGNDFNVSNHPILCQADAEALEQQVIAADGISGVTFFDSNNGCL